MRLSSGNFRIHHAHFKKELMECLERVRKWLESERQDFWNWINRIVGEKKIKAEIANGEKKSIKVPDVYLPLREDDAFAIRRTEPKQCYY